MWRLGQLLPLVALQALAALTCFLPTSSPPAGLKLSSENGTARNFKSSCAIRRALLSPEPQSEFWSYQYCQANQNVTVAIVRGPAVAQYIQNFVETNDSGV